MAMTKKHFEAIADVVFWNDQLFGSNADREKFAEELARTLAQFNGRFDRGRFVQAATEGNCPKLRRLLTEPTVFDAA